MAESWLHWIVYIAQHEGKTAFHGKLMDTLGPINDPEVITNVRDTLYYQVYGKVPDEEEIDKDFPPIVILTWTLVKAQRGPGVRPQDNGDSTDPT